LSNNFRIKTYSVYPFSKHITTPKLLFHIRMKGRVIKSTGSWYLVLDEQNQLIKCRIKGKFRLDGIKHTNPIAVGDYVIFESEDDNDDMGVIKKIIDRKNYIIRKASNLSKQTHVIASNIDCVLILATLDLPTTSTGFIDRILVTAEAYHIPAVIVFNKCDLFDAESMQHLDALIDLYQNKIGYKCLKVSALENSGIDLLRKLLTNQTTLVVGHSGVGKSTLLNTIQPSLNLKTGALSNYHLKGQHTTTFAEMHPLNFGGFIIDTPGIREFGLVDIPDAELSHYFKEMRPHIGGCKFNNCKHINEPGCNIINLVQKGDITELRYHSYMSMLLKEDLYA
jgi:ribosome biogenesis GTPase